MIANIDPNAGRSLSLGTIETLCSNYDGECAALEEQIAALEADLEAVKQKHLRGLKRRAAAVATAEAELHSAVESSPGLFVKPRTITVHGIKVGFATSTGSISWDDDEQVVELIREMFPKRVKELIKTTETPKKNALKALTDDERARIGCSIDGAGDVVVLSRVAGDVEKLVNKLIEKLVEAMVSKE